MDVEIKIKPIIVLGLGLAGGILGIIYGVHISYILYESIRHGRGIEMLILSMILFILFGILSISGAILGWKKGKVGYMLNIGAGIFALLSIVITGGINFYWFFIPLPGNFGFLSVLGTILSLAGGIFGYVESVDWEPKDRIRKREQVKKVLKIMGIIIAIIITLAIVISFVLPVVLCFMSDCA